MINNLIEALPVLAILFAGGVGMLAGGAMLIPVVKWMEVRGYL